MKVEVGARGRGLTMSKELLGKWHMWLHVIRMLEKEVGWGGQCLLLFATST